MGCGTLLQPFPGHLFSPNALFLTPQTTACLLSTLFCSAARVCQGPANVCSQGAQSLSQRNPSPFHTPDHKLWGGLRRCAFPRPQSRAGVWHMVWLRSESCWVNSTRLILEGLFIGGIRELRIFSLIVARPIKLRSRRCSMPVAVGSTVLWHILHCLRKVRCFWWPRLWQKHLLITWCFLFFTDTQTLLPSLPCSYVSPFG